MTKSEKLDGGSTERKWIFLTRLKEPERAAAPRMTSDIKVWGRFPLGKLVDSRRVDKRNSLGVIRRDEHASSCFGAHGRAEPRSSRRVDGAGAVSPRAPRCSSRRPNTFPGRRRAADKSQSS